MISTNLSPLGISWSVRLADTPFSERAIQRIKVSFSENQHDVAYLELVGVPSSYISDYVEKPIQVKVSISGGKSFSFHGYVSHVEGKSSTIEGTVNNNPFQILTMVCIGSSHVLREKNTMAWNNVTLLDIVSEIAKEYRMGYSVPKDSYVFKRLVQTEESLWMLLTRACDQLGYYVTICNSHIHVWDKDKVLGRQPSYTTLRGIKVKKSDYSPLPGDVISIESTIGTPDVSNQIGDKTVTYLDENGKIVSVDASQLDTIVSFGEPKPGRFDNKLSTSVDSFEKATRYIKSRIKKTYPHTADAVVYGDPSVQPGGVVRVDGYGGAFDGFWYVSSVSHELLTNSLTTYLKLEKDGNYDNIPKIPKVQQYVQPPMPILIKDKWVFRTEYVNVYN